MQSRRKLRIVCWNRGSDGGARLDNRTEQNGKRYVPVSVVGAKRMMPLLASALYPDARIKSKSKRTNEGGAYDYQY
jgi:hypothetical protein